jgi:hypothetical protein
MVRRTAIASAALALAMFAEAAHGAAAPRIPSSAQPGRERDLFFDRPFPPPPRIQLQDGRPAPVITPRKGTKSRSKARQPNSRRN